MLGIQALMHKTIQLLARGSRNAVFSKRLVAYAGFFAGLGTNCNAAGNLYLIPEYSYGVNVLDSSVMPENNFNLGALYQFESSIFLLGGRIGYAFGTSNNYYFPSNSTSYTKQMSSPFVGLSTGVDLHINSSVKVNLLLNLETSIGGTYGINCSTNSSECQSSSGKGLNTISFGLEDQIFYIINPQFAVGLNTGLMFNSSQLSNYAAISGTQYNVTQTSSSVAGFIGIVFSYTVF